METKTDTVYEYVLLDFSLEGTSGIHLGQVLVREYHDSSLFISNAFCLCDS